MTRGLRNNNPANIRFSPANKWKGEIPHDKNTDREFCQFTDISYGVRAAIILFRKYIRDGYTTLDKMISHFAPPCENSEDYPYQILSFVNKHCKGNPLPINLDEYQKDPLHVDLKLVYVPFTFDDNIIYGTDYFYDILRAVFYYESNYYTTRQSIINISNHFNLF